MKPGSPRKKIDPMVLVALERERAKRRERSLAVPLLLIAAVLAVGLGFLAWKFWPEDPPNISLTAYDQVARPEEPVALWARVEDEDRQEPINLGGFDLLFQVAATRQAETVSTDAGGAAHIDWRPAKAPAGPTEFLVRYADQKTHKSSRNAGRVFVWPADASLLVVDVDHALVNVDEETLRAARLPELTARPGAAAALRRLPGYKIAYLTALAERPAAYRNLRSWLRPLAATDRDQFPDGPLLGPSQPLGEGDRETFIQGQIETLKSAYTGPAIGIAGRAKEARLFFDAGWKTCLVGDAGDVPDGVTAVESWAELPQKLAR
jgi:hypothetical protein